MNRVFVAEDSALLRQELLSTTPWAQLNCQVVGASGNGKEAEQMIRTLRPDLVITDICMPQMDGLELIEALADLPHIRYILISAYSKFEYAKKAIKLNVCDYVLKPIDDKELYTAIQRVMLAGDGAARDVQAPAEQSQTEQASDKHIAALTRYVQQHYKQELSLSQAAKTLYISESYISKLCRRKLKASFAEYVAQVRIRQAETLLQQSSGLRVSQVAQMVGFNDYRYFCTTFKKLVGIPPKQYQINGCKKGAQ